MKQPPIDEPVSVCQLQEIKEGYVARQDSTKGQLDSFVQSHVDEIERASVLLEVERPVLEIGRNLGNLSQRCRQMNDELSEKKISSIVSIARRNLKELETQIVFYEELPSKVRTAAAVALSIISLTKRNLSFFCRSRSCIRSWTLATMRTFRSIRDGYLSTTGDRRFSTR